MPTPSDFAARAEVYRDVVRGVGRLKCEACPRERRCDTWDGQPVGLYLFRDFPRCPASYLREPWWREVMNYDEASECGPLADWPDEYPFFVVEGRVMLRRYRADRAAGGG